MARTRAFENHSVEYEKWFDKNPHAYQSELNAIKQLLPSSGKGLEIGVGSGRFAIPLGITIGIEPSEAMGKIATAKGIEVIHAVAEKLSLADRSFDFVLFVTTVCFLDSLAQSFKEAWRVLKDRGQIIIGLIDKDSALGKEYEKRQAESRFYQQARFHSIGEVKDRLTETGFVNFCFRQTIFSPLDQIVTNEPIKNGYGEGAFVVVRAEKFD